MSQPAVVIHLTKTLPNALNKKAEYYCIGAEPIPWRRIQADLEPGHVLAFESMHTLLAFGTKDGSRHPSWDRAWGRVKPVLKEGVEIALLNEGITLKYQDKAIMKVLEALAVAIGDHKAEMGRARLAARGRQGGNWVLPDKAFLKKLVAKVEEEGLLKGCKSMGISSTTYYRWRDQGYFEK